jgi:hypothetical protein
MAKQGCGHENRIATEDESTATFYKMQSRTFLEKFSKFLEEALTLQNIVWEVN